MLTQRLALGCLTVVTVLVSAYVILSRSVPRVERLSGVLAPVRSDLAIDVVASVDPAKLLKGPIVALTADSSAVYLLQHHGWLRVTRDSVEGPFGNGSRGSPGAIASGADIAVHDSMVFVLDRSVRAVSAFTTNGAWIATYRLLAPDRIFSFTPERIAVAADGRILVSGFRRESAQAATRLVLASRTGGGFDSLMAVPSTLFDPLVLVAGTGDHVYAIMANDYRFIEIGDTSFVPVFSRMNPPRTPMPDSVRRSLARYVSQIPIPTAMPDYYPVVMNAAQLESGDFLVAVITAIDSVMIESLDARGRPLQRFSPAALPMPVGVTPYGVITLREEANASIVERRRIPNRGFHD